MSGNQHVSECEWDVLDSQFRQMETVDLITLYDNGMEKCPCCELIMRGLIACIRIERCGFATTEV